MPKHKVGDVVRVRTDLEHRKQYGVDKFMCMMMEFCGVDRQIVKVTSRGGYYLSGASCWTFTDEMLDEEGVGSPDLEVGE